MDYNKIGGLSFALWGLLHVGVGLVGMFVYFTGGVAPMLEFVDMDASLNDQSSRMADLVVQFYEALFLIGLVVTVLGFSLNWKGSVLGLWLNTLLVAGIDLFFVWFEVIPGHRPFFVAVISIALLILGALFCSLGVREKQSY